MPGPLHGFKVVRSDDGGLRPARHADAGRSGRGRDQGRSAARGDHARHVATRRGGFSGGVSEQQPQQAIRRPEPEAPRRAVGSQAPCRRRRRAGAELQARRGRADRRRGGRPFATSIRRSSTCRSPASDSTDPTRASRCSIPLVQAVSGLTTVQARLRTRRDPAWCAPSFPTRRPASRHPRPSPPRCWPASAPARASTCGSRCSTPWCPFSGARTWANTRSWGAESERERAQSWIDLIYETRDGFITVAVNQNKEWERFARAAERPDMLDDERFRTPGGPRALQRTSAWS